MTRAKLLGTATILAALIATPALAQNRHSRQHSSGIGPAAAGVAGAAIGVAGAIATAPYRGGYYGDPGYAYGGRTYDDSYAYGGPSYDDSYGYQSGPVYGGAAYGNSDGYGGQPYLASRSGRGSCGPQIGATFLGADGRWYPCN